MNLIDNMSQINLLIEMIIGHANCFVNTNYE